MRIYTKSGDLAFKTFTFPDGQPHFKLETYEREFDTVTIEVALRSGSDLLLTVLASDTLRQHGYQSVLLDVRYLLGARMDRAISVMEPFTLQSVARIINSCGFSTVRILDVHSEVAIRLIRNSENVLPRRIVQQVHCTCENALPVAPDKGAVTRLEEYFVEYVRAEKTRDLKTGKLSGFTIVDPSFIKNSPVLIIDDICDGGGTFVGLAKELRKAGATKVYLFVTHGVFSKGPDCLEGIDCIYTTDSYCPNRIEGNWGYVPVRPVTVIPVSMERM